MSLQPKTIQIFKLSGKGGGELFQGPPLYETLVLPELLWYTGTL